MTERIAVTVYLPKAQAEGLLNGAACAGMIDAEGRVVMDHFILARDPAPLEAVSKPIQTPVETVLEGTFNGA